MAGCAVGDQSRGDVATFGDGDYDVDEGVIVDEGDGEGVRRVAGDF